MYRCLMYITKPTDLGHLRYSTHVKQFRTLDKAMAWHNEQGLSLRIVCHEVWHKGELLAVKGKIWST